MKKIVLAAAFAAVSTTAFAGDLGEPVMEDVVEVVETNTSSSNNLIIPLLLLALIAAGS